MEDLQTLLRFGVDNGILDVEKLNAIMKAKIREEYLNRHSSRVWEGKDGKWYTLVPDLTKSKGTRLLKRTSKSALEDAIVKSYKEADSLITFEVLFNEWSKKKLEFGEILQQTYDRYKVDFNKFFVAQQFHKRIVVSTTEDDLELFLRKCIRDFNLTAKSFSNLRTLVTGMYKYAKKRGYTTLSISAFLGDLDISNKVFKRRVTDEREQVFTEAETTLIEEYIYTKHSKDLSYLGVLLAMYTGLRVGEIVALKWEDFRGGDTLHISRREVLYYDPDTGSRVYEVVEGAKTLAGQRTVLLTDKCIRLMQMIYDISGDCEYIFTKQGARMHKFCLTSLTPKICQRLGLNKRSTHKLRKTYATKLLDAGVPSTIIVSQMGHTDISTTERYYHFNNKNKEIIKETLNKALER